MHFLSGLGSFLLTIIFFIFSAFMMLVITYLFPFWVKNFYRCLICMLARFVPIKQRQGYIDERYGHFIQSFGANIKSKEQFSRAEASIKTFFECLDLVYQEAPRLISQNQKWRLERKEQWCVDENYIEEIIRLHVEMDKFTKQILEDSDRMLLNCPGQKKR